MSVPASDALSGLVDDYRRHPALGGFDELLGTEGVRPHQQSVAEAIEAIGLGGLLAARAEARSSVLDEGVSYGTPGSSSRLWNIDPLPMVLDQAEWAHLERGLTQRAQLLDLVLRDLYTERSLLRRRVLPATAVLSHPGFARQADQVGASGRQLLLTATDLGRDATGAWRVISDRTQSPVGAGYAMVTRRIVSRVMAGLHRASDLARLRGFFHTMTAALSDAAPTSAETPRVVVLAPGATSDHAFDTSFLATMLGFPVAEADDLVTSQGRIWLRAGDRLEPVDVVLRRVHSAMSDPLEFRGNSQIGVPGLVEAVRAGQVRVANPIGSGVLDNPALIAHLEPIARALLGEAPILDSPTTWWCGDPSALSHVTANLDRLVVKPLARGHADVRYGWELGQAEREDLLTRLRTEPWAWCGQEPLDLSTAPVATSRGLEPRRFMLRTFGVAAGGGYAFLPGGLGRVAGSVGQHTISSAHGALAKDVWLPSSALPDVLRATTRPRLTLPAAARPVEISPRVAGTLLTIGRHAERAEATARLLKVADDVTEDHSSRPGTPGSAAMIVLTDALAGISGIDPRYGEAPVDYLRRATLDPGLPGGVAYSAGVLTDRAQRVRDLMSVDSWSVFARLENTLAGVPDADDQLQPLLDDVLESLLAYAGIMAQSMVRDSSWAFLDAGGRLERAQHTLKLLRATLLRADPPAVAGLVAEAVLRACESIITHRRRAAAGTGPAGARESAFVLLVQDDSNPRSIAHQLIAVAADLRLVGDEALAARAEALHDRLAELPGPVIRAAGPDPSTGSEQAGPGRRSLGSGPPGDRVSTDPTSGLGGSVPGDQGNPPLDNLAAVAGPLPPVAEPVEASGQWFARLAADLDAFEEQIVDRHFVRQATRRSAEPLATGWTQVP